MAALEEHGSARRAVEPLSELTCILCPGRGLDPCGRAALCCNLCPRRGLDPRDRGDRGRGCSPVAAVVSHESVLMFIEWWAIEVRHV